MHDLNTVFEFKCLPLNYFANGELIIKINLMIRSLYKAIHLLCLFDCKIHTRVLQEVSKMIKINHLPSPISNVTHFNYAFF